MPTLFPFRAVRYDVEGDPEMGISPPFRRAVLPETVEPALIEMPSPPFSYAVLPETVEPPPLTMMPRAPLLYAVLPMTMEL